jgi:ClpX C4-type zinc finger protein
MTSKSKPPPVLNGARVLAYANLGHPRHPVAKGTVFVGNKPLGRVSSLVITETPSVPGRPGRGVLLVYCTKAWSLRGVAGFSSVAGAKHRAERMFPDASTRWVPSGVTKAHAERYLKRVWAGQECSFCGRRPDQIQQMVAAKRVRICDRCISESSAIVNRS